MLEHVQYVKSMHSMGSTKIRIEIGCHSCLLAMVTKNVSKTYNNSCYPFILVSNHRYKCVKACHGSSTGYTSLLHEKEC